MMLTKTQLRLILQDYNTLANRLIHTDFREYNSVLKRYLSFLSSTEVINDYIAACGVCDQNMEEEFRQVRSGATFDLGESDEDEVRNICAILSYIVDNNVPVPTSIGMSYRSKGNFQEVLKEFNERVTLILIRHIEHYLSKLGIEMGLDDNVAYNISGNGQVNIANDNATINAINIPGSIDIAELSSILSNIQKLSEESELSQEDKEIVRENTEVILAEAKSTSPRKIFLKSTVNSLKMIKGTTEFAAAIVSLWQFLQPFIQ